MRVHEHIHIDRTNVIAAKRYRITAEIVVAKGATQFAEIPAQRGQRILCVLEQERCQVVAIYAFRTEQEVSKDAPCLVAAHVRQRLSSPPHLRDAK